MRILICHDVCNYHVLHAYTQNKETVTKKEKTMGTLQGWVMTNKSC